ncbi:MAG: response regulator transcription factor [Chitinophagales bacterium]|jgi:DNA-binding response OmpR family regulator|nr:response regulator transcription factor [Chitinophagales bacterium]HNI45958.1 response regulator transcription factor [Chitinophagales bacterium]
MTTKPTHILYVEDDVSLGFVTKDNLELKGYQITHCMDGETAINTFDQYDFDLCILDVMLPKIDGFSIAQHIRQHNAHVPILFLSARSMKEDRIKGLQIGADDYITKPYSIEELVLKIQVFLRRTQVIHATTPTPPPAEAVGVHRIGQYVFDYPNLSLIWNEQRQSLTQKEADLLLLLFENKNQVVKRSRILTQLWGEDDYFLGRSMDVFISRLRKYLKQDQRLTIENIHGVGFRLEEKI